MDSVLQILHGFQSTNITWIPFYKYYMDFHLYKCLEHILGLKIFSKFCKSLFLISWISCITSFLLQLWMYPKCQSMLLKLYDFSNPLHPPPTKKLYNLLLYLWTIVFSFFGSEKILNGIDSICSTPPSVDSLHCQKYKFIISCNLSLVLSLISMIHFEIFMIQNMVYQ